MGEKVTRRRVLAGLGGLGGSLAAGGGIAAALGSGGFEIPSGWPMAGHDPGRTCHAEDQAGPKDGAEIAWERDLRTGVNPQVPIVADGTVYGIGGTILAVDDESGTVRSRLNWYVESLPVVVRTEVYETPTVVFDGHEGAIGLDADLTASGGGLDTDPVRWNTGSSGGPAFWEHWRSRSIEDDVGNTPPIATDGRIVTERYGVMAVDADDGTVDWRTNGTDLDGDPVARSGAIYGTTTDRSGSEEVVRLVSVDLETGAVTTLREDFDPSPSDEGHYWGQPTATDDRLLIADGDRLFGFDYDGNRQWSYTTSRGAGPGRTVAAGDGVAFVGITEGGISEPVRWIAAVDASDGTELWVAEANGRYEDEYGQLRIPLAVADGVIYVSQFDGVVALDASNGDVLWERQLTEEPEEGSPPAVANGRVYVALGHHLYALEEA